MGDESPPKDRRRAQFNEPEVLPSKVAVPFAVGEKLHESNPRMQVWRENSRPLSRSERKLSEQPWQKYAQQVERGIVPSKVYEKTPSYLHHREMLTNINEFIGGAERVLNTRVDESEDEVVRALY